MEVSAKNSAGNKATQAKDNSRLILAPKDYFMGPFFAATKQKERREVLIGDKHYLIGGFHPLRKDRLPPAMDVRHARAIFTLLSFQDMESPGESREIRFPFNEFCRRYAKSSGGRYMRDVKNVLSEVTDSFIQITDINTKVATSYRIIERVAIREPAIKRRDAQIVTSPQTEFPYNSCTLSPEFYNLLSDIVELRYLKLSVFTSIRSPLAQAIYLYIPSRAAHDHSETDPFEIVLEKLLKQVAFPCPAYPSKRKEIFTRHEDEGRSILQQLDGVETRRGIFRIRVVETVNKLDWKLQCWIEGNQEPRVLGETKLEAAYLEGGRSVDDLRKALAQKPALSLYELDLLKEAKVEYVKNRLFFEKAKALLPHTQFVELLAGAKADELEGRRATKNSTARLIHRIKQKIKSR